jgi:LemA protein
MLPTLIIIVAIVVVLALIFISIYNKLIRLGMGAEEGFSTMDVYMKKRYDLVPNLVEVVKNYAKHEKETFNSVVEARNSAMNASSEEKAGKEGAFVGALKSLFALAESYPDLKSNENFLNLQNQLKEVEGDIAISRKYYNGTVKIYNIAVRSIPSSIVAKMFNFNTKPLFEIEAEQRENVKIEL